MDISRSSEFYRSTERVSGSDKSHIFIVFPLGSPNVKQATDQAIESQPGAVALMDSTVTMECWYIPYVYGQIKLRVEGTPLIDSSIKYIEQPSEP